MEDLIMKVTLEQIDELRKRANVGYKEAKEALEMFDGDLVEALAYLDGEKKTKADGINGSDILGKIKSLISKGNKIKLKISKNDTPIINVPITLVILVGIFIFPFLAASLILAVVTGCKIRLVKNNGEDCSINKHIERVSNVVNDATQKVTEEFKKA
jgi:hypothetical protein